MTDISVTGTVSDGRQFSLVHVYPGYEWVDQTHRRATPQEEDVLFDSFKAKYGVNLLPNPREKQSVSNEMKERMAQVEPIESVYHWLRDDSL